ncbi:hypothetical protein PBI_SHEPARD_24 [Arthrobacter phage Shepard]|nr:hypothetical protein PBI_SHEPARD_24 [Arthrobacter phage Shepard]UYL88219.1 hypothetical protein SEA_LILHUDDY_24 [Arthrobacter phage LilHuddy]
MAQTPTDPTKAQVWITKGIDDLDFEFYIPQGPKGDPGGITLGTLIPASANLNDYKTSGVYRKLAPAEATQLLNFPKEALAGVLRVYERATDFGWQEYEGLTAGQEARVLYRRTFVAGVWSPWRAMVTNRVDQTAGRAIYQWDDINSREQLIYGDTGQRSVVTDQAWVDALTGSGLTLAGSQIARVRRVGNLVELNWAFDKTATGSVTCTAGFPLGFRPSSVWNALGLTSSMGLTRAYNGGGATPMIYQSGNTTQLNVTACLTYTTTDAWPTSLPGTAVGGIPNT